MTENWTKGPWFVCGEPGHEPQNDAWYPGLTIGSDTEGTRICDLTPLRAEAATRANAYLIAAAPDLYKATERAFALLGFDCRKKVDPESSDYNQAFYDVFARCTFALAQARNEEHEP
jgi:hypothetical protein